MVLLGVVEVRRLEDLGGDGAVAGLAESRLESCFGTQCRIPLLIIEPVNSRAVLSPRIVALAHALGGIVGFPEDGKELRVANLLRIVDDQHNFVVPRLSTADFVIGWIRGTPGGVTHRSGIDAGDLPELALRTPEAAQAKHRLAQVGRKRGLQGVAIDVVLLGNSHRRPTARQCSTGGRNLQGFFAEPHRTDLEVRLN